MAQIETWFNQELKHPVKVQYLDGNIFSADNAGNLIGVNVFDNGEPASLSGSVSASVIRSDGATVAVSGTLSENQAFVVLPQAAYAVPGVISIVIKLTSGTDVTSLCAVVGNVYMSTTDSVVDPGTIIPSVETLIAAIEAAISGIPADYSDLLEAVANDYSSSKTYPTIGQYVWQEGVLKRNIVPITSAESYNPAHWVDDVIGDGISGLRDQFYSIGAQIPLPFDASFLTLGSDILINTGGNHTSISSCRSSTYTDIAGAIRIELNDSRYTFDVWRYTAKSVGSLIKAIKPQYDHDPVVITCNDSAAAFRFAVHKVDGTEFTSTDAANVISGMKWYKMVDNTVSLKSTPAEAYSVGKIFEEYNCLQVSPDLTNATGGTLNGITYSVSNGVASFDGTATSSFAYNVLGTNYDSIPSWIHENTRYYIKMNKNNDDPLRVRVVLYDSNYATIRNAYDSSNDGYFIIPSFEGVAGVAVRYFVKQGATVDCTSRLVITNAFSNIELSEKQPEAKVRLMQYNMGRWNMGAAVDSTTEQYLRQDNYLSIMANMRQMFGEYQPDVIGAEEFEMERDVYTSDGSSVYTHVNFGTEVYNRLYPNILYDMGNVASRLALMSKYNITSGGRKQIDYTYTYNGETKSGTGYVRICHVNIANKNVCFAVTAMVQSSGDEPMAEGIYKRQVFIPLVLDLLDGEEYAFVISDVNNGGVERTFDNVSSSAAEGTDIHDNILVPNGFNSVHGDYFPWQMTYYGRNVHSMAAIDNIFYKDNGKVVFCGFKVLNEYYNTEENKLISDHIPIIADFVLM